MPAHITRTIQGQSTEVFLQQFSDRMLILVTQMGKVGSLTQATIPATTPLSSTLSSSPEETPSLPEPPVSIVLTPLMGTSADAYHQTITNIYVSQVATLVWSGSPSNLLPVVVGVALGKKLHPQEDDTGMAEGEREIFIGIMEMVRDCLSQVRWGDHSM